MNSARRNLIICPIGDGSVHNSWLSHPELRSFDLFLIYYGDREGVGQAEATYRLRRKGFKWELIDHVIKEYGETVGRYANIWCPDNDIRADTLTINRMFELFHKYALQLAQPAISGGEVSYQTLRQHPGVVLRYSPFVEVMCPLFTRAALWRVAPTLLESRSGWGLDLLWPRFFSPHEMAILDAVGVEHTGPLGRGENYQKLGELGVSPGEEFDRIVAHYGGFDRRLHRRFVRGKVKLPAVVATVDRSGFWTRLKHRLGLRRAA